MRRSLSFLARLALASTICALAPAAQVTPPAVARVLPELDHEPRLQVLLARAPEVAIELLGPTQLEVGARRTTLAPGTLRLEVAEGGWRVAGGAQVVRGTGVLRGTGVPRFALDALPAFGAPRRLQLAGDLLVRADGDALEVCEEVPMERYLASVVGAEMNPGWPAQALAAQAIVARSYAAARWMERADEFWQLHWHYGVDMAYHGWSERDAQVAAAIAPTRGEVLTYRGFPVLALFHASSGGRTESFARVKPDQRAPDGVTPIAAAMPVVDDPAAVRGARGLALEATHGRWKADLPLPEVGAALQRWAAADASRPRIGTVEGVSIEARHVDSRRVATVSVRHRLDGQTRFQHLPATEFRLAVSPVRIRSVLWDRCVVASKEPGFLVLEGRGFGHGCGLSQVSAWQLAREGASAEAIVARFYRGAEIERRY